MMAGVSINTHCVIGYLDLFNLQECDGVAALPHQIKEIMGDTIYSALTEFATIAPDSSVPSTVQVSGYLSK
jgi:hypothetical protein